MGNKSQKRSKHESNTDASSPIANLPTPSTNLHSPPDNLSSPKGEIVQKYSKYESNKQKVSSTWPVLREIKTQENNNNMIKMRLIIGFEDVNRPTKILYNIKENVPDCDIKELNEENTELYINGKQYKYKSYFIPEEEGIYDILLIIKILMTNCCCLFYDINNLQSLDLSSFNSQNVTNMSYMFYNCKNLKNLYLSSLNTRNVTNMSYMFSHCSFLKSIDLSSFNTQNVNNMSFMFDHCSSLESLNLSSFNTQNVNNMSYMFNHCSFLKSIDLTSFNTQNVTNMSFMFYNCEELQSLDLSSFNTKNVTNMRSKQFSNLRRIILSFAASNISRYFSKDKIIYV